MRQELACRTRTVYRDQHDPACYLARIRAEEAAMGNALGTQAFVAALAPAARGPSPRSASPNW